MAFADPQSVTINAVAQTLPRVSSGDNKGAFRKDDSTVELVVQHAYGKRVRRVIRLNHNKVAVDPLVPSYNVPYSMSVSLVVDAPVVGYTVAEQKQIVDAVTAYLTASSGARTTQLLGGES
ncbi:coat protein [ssRNA phage SRR7976310_13]|uniref:Coat protein n=1 Tax=ssRNA phage SRR7976310_13 TaxID=2786675 RepID=A0A8S5L0Y3_9VIRU|nr:coat protein [ssRNA phage SRR7976310_13]DAD51139.1 TPA_asm: coat protein [ssRNA phage SRR7976310_13]